MLPIVIIAYRHGIGLGLASGLTFAVIQQLLGLNNLSYVTGWQSVVAVIVLDYVIAFTVLGLGGVFKGKLSTLIKNDAKRQSTELWLGMVFVCVLRYICHTVAGATVWAGLSIPTEAALVYSIGYNATYMIPESIVSALAAGFVGSVLDFSKRNPERFTSLVKGEGWDACELLPHISTLVAVLTVAVDTVLIAPFMQNEESGEFDFSAISSAPWLAIGIISTVGVALVSGLIIARALLKKRQSKQA